MRYLSLFMVTLFLISSCSDDKGPTSSNGTSTYSVTLSNRGSQAFKVNFNGVTRDLPRNGQVVCGHFEPRIYSWQAFKYDAGVRTWLSFAAGQIDVNANRTARVYDDMVRWD